jgi:hypothetical protein
VIVQRLGVGRRGGVGRVLIQDGQTRLEVI